jgi:hypothetical protein
MWEGILAAVTLLAVVVVAVVATIVLEELSDLPELIRINIRGRTARRSLSARVTELEARMTAAERKVTRPAA